MSKHTEAARAALANGNIREAVEALTSHLEEAPKAAPAKKAPAKKAPAKKKGSK